MNTISNQPTQGPPIELYKGSPFALVLVFPENYIIPALTAEIRRNDTLITETLQPTIAASSQERTVVFSSQQTNSLPATCKLIVRLDGVAKAIFSMAVSIEGAPSPGGTTLALRLDENLTIQLTLSDTDAVRAAQAQVALAEGYAQDAFNSSEGAEGFKSAAESAANAAEQEAGVAEDHADAAILTKNEVVALKADVVAIAGQVAADKEAILGIAPRKLDNWQVDTYADALIFSATLDHSAFIEVRADETQINAEFPEGPRTLYFWNTISLQEPLLL